MSLPQDEFGKALILRLADDLGKFEYRIADLESGADGVLRKAEARMRTLLEEIKNSTNAEIKRAIGEAKVELRDEVEKVLKSHEDKLNEKITAEVAKQVDEKTKEIGKEIARFGEIVEQQSHIPEWLAKLTPWGLIKWGGAAAVSIASVSSVMLPVFITVLYYVVTAINGGPITPQSIPTPASFQDEHDESK